MALTADHAAPTPPPPPYATQWKKIDALLAKDLTVSAAPLVAKPFMRRPKKQHDTRRLRACAWCTGCNLLSRKAGRRGRKIHCAARSRTLSPHCCFPGAAHFALCCWAGLYTQLPQRKTATSLYERTAGGAASQDQAAPQPKDSEANGDAAADGGTGLPTWDLARLGAAIVRHYVASTADEPQKQAALTTCRRWANSPPLATPRATPAAPACTTC